MRPKSPIIALVDDDKIFQLTSARMIQALDLSNKILQFSNGEEALQYLKNHALDSDGWMFLADYARIKLTFQKQIQIFMISSSIDPRDILRAQNNSDVRDYITKPVTPEKFKELFESVA